jgi:excisionase family DNA binding protein
MVAQELKVLDRLDVDEASNAAKVIDHLYGKYAGESGLGVTVGETLYVLSQSTVAVLVRTLTALGAGHSVALAPSMDDGAAVRVRDELTTTETAELLGMSRPTVIKLIEAGELPCRMVGTHRRVSRRDALAYEKALFEKRHQALAELTALDEELGLYEEPAR